MFEAIHVGLLAIALAHQPAAARLIDDCLYDCTRIWSAVTPAVVKTRVEPRSPWAGYIAGVVIVDVCIDNNGKVARVKVLRSIPAVDAAVVSAVTQWTFEPATFGGRPIATVQTLAVSVPLQ